MVHDNPHLEVWRSLPLDQIELNIFCKWSRLNQFEKMILTYHSFTPTYLKFELTFVVIDTKGGQVIHKDSKDRGSKQMKWHCKGIN
jgi:hypothetical protein